MHILENIVCLIFGLSLIFEKIVTWTFLSRLRRFHAATWSQLGEPATMMPTFRLFGYLWRRDFNALSDEKMVVIGRSFRVLWLCTIVSFALMVVIGIPEAIRLFSEFSHR